MGFLSITLPRFSASRMLSRMSYLDLPAAVAQPLISPLRSYSWTFTASCRTVNQLQMSCFDVQGKSGFAPTQWVDSIVLQRFLLQHSLRILRSPHFFLQTLPNPRLSCCSPWNLEPSSTWYQVSYFPSICRQLKSNFFNRSIMNRDLPWGLWFTLVTLCALQIIHYLTSQCRRDCAVCH